ncbi:MAG: homing endonuclease associated repeat-containing protein, partial [Actinomycetota bacterium]
MNTIKPPAGGFFIERKTVSDLNPENHVPAHHQNHTNACDSTGNHRMADGSARRRRGSQRPLDNASGERDFNDLNKDEIIALVKKAAAELGHRPNQYEFWQMAGAKKEHMRRLFGSYRELVQEAGFEALGPGFHLTRDALLEDWAAVARRLGKVPTVQQYDKAGKYSHRAFRQRWKSWHDVPAAVAEWVEARWPDRQWDDVAALTRKYTEQRQAAGDRLSRKKYHRLTSTPDEALTTTQSTSSTSSTPSTHSVPSRPKKSADPVYGQPIMLPELATAPTNELGVIYLFGVLAKVLGLIVLRLQAEFPDCEALRRGPDGRWRRIRVEFEFESRNFLLHGHDVNGCDLIVCWVNNWPSCPVEVLELS